MQRLIRLSLFFLFLSTPLFSQSNDYELGGSSFAYRQQGGYFDYSDPSTVNIKVNVWGFVRYPGRYLVPIYTSAFDLLSFAGGPTDAADLEDLRIYRVYEDSTHFMLKFNYNSLLWDTKLETRKQNVPEIKAGDTLLVPGEPRLYFRDNFAIVLSVISTLVSLAILALNIIRK